MEQNENTSAAPQPAPAPEVPKIVIVRAPGIQIEGPDTPESPLNMIVPACLGSCSLLCLVDMDKRTDLLEQCAQKTQVWCHGPRDGQAPGRTVCGQPEEAKRQLWNTIHPNRNRTT